MTRRDALYAGTCSVCGKRFPPGAEIDYDGATKRARHWACQPFVPPEGAIWLSQGEGYGGQPYTVGQVVRNLPRRVREDGEPEVLYVLHAQEEYISRDGMSFGVGAEAGYLYTAVCRAATAEEAAPLLAAEAEMRAQVQARHRLDALARRARREGERPEQPQLPTAAAGVERLLDTRTIYGGGDAWLVALGAVWYIQGNGADGDNWAENNLAGTIAWRLADPDGAIAAELRALAQQVAREQKGA